HGGRCCSERWTPTRTSSTPPSSSSPRWAPPAGRRIAPSCSGGSKSSATRFRSIRMRGATRSLLLFPPCFLTLLLYIHSSFSLLADSLAGLDVRFANQQIGEIREWPLGEICWYFTDSWEQFRISGIIDVIDGSSLDPAKLQQREKAWFASSVKSRSQYLGQSPGVPVANDDHIKDVHIDPSAGPVDAYCLLTLDPEKVDYVNLKSNQRLMFTRTQEGDEFNDWMAEKVSP
uniref:pyridoxal 5'-phosphate synthase n=4 Tax=Triticinae TaxID=1648030 RepID=A0A453J807_AEGTS